MLPATSERQRHCAWWRAALALLTAVVATTSVLVFYRQLLFGGSLRGWDWTVHWQYYDWIRTSLTRYGTLPLYMVDALHTPDFVGNPQSPLGPLVWLLYFLPTDAYIKFLIVLWATGGLLGMFALLSDLGVEWPVAMLIAAVFGFNGYFFCHISVGHFWSLGSFLLPGILCLFRRAVLGRRACLWFAAALNVSSIFEGQHHPFIWNNIFLVLYAVAWSLERRDVSPLRAAVVFLAASAGVGAVKLLPIYSEFASYAPDVRHLGFPPAALLWSLIGPAQNVHSYGFPWEYCFYIGIIGFALLLVGLVAGARRAWTWIVTGGFFLLISLDLSAWPWIPEPWSMIKELPIWITQRLPSRFVIVALTAFLIAAGMGLQRLWAHGLARLGRWGRPGLLLVTGVTLIALYANLFSLVRPWERAAVGPPLPSRTHRFGDPAPTHTGVMLKAFQPNRLIYQVETSAPGRVVLPVKEWYGRMYWRPVGRPGEVQNGWLAVSVPAGKQEIVVVYQPRYLRLGVFVSVATAAAIVAWETLRRRFARK
jgi:hypothetical protein